MHKATPTTDRGVSGLVSLMSKGLVSAIVPARNEESVIAACVRSLATQPEVAEILVVNDQSSDGTAGVVRGLAMEISGVRMLETRDVPAGWIGKNNAVWSGAREARADWLLFTDADAEVAAGTVRKALETAQENSAALVSLSPEQLTVTWYEKSLIPFVYTRLAKHFSFAAVNDPRSTAAAANGQFLMIRRDAYEAIGGHASVAGEVLEDVALAKRVKAAGFRIWFGPGKGLVRARMYRTLAAMWEGWTKNLYLLVGGSPRAIYRELFAVVPWVAVLLLLLGLKFPFALLLGIGFLVARHAEYGLALSNNRYPLSLIFYYVPAVLLYTGVLWRSYRAHVAGRVVWKGRQVLLGASDRLR